jgi:ParB-like chromosome segregation protein Spo0J
MQNTEPVVIRLPLSRLSANTEYEHYSRPLTTAEARDLRASIAAAGCILQPLIVEFVQAKTSYDVIDGYNRWRDAIALGFLEVPCIQIFTEQQRIEALTANATRRQLTDEERSTLLAKGRMAFTDAAKKLIDPLRALYHNGDLSRILGPANVLALLNSSPQKQEEIYAKIQVAFGTPQTSSSETTALHQRIQDLSNQVASIERTKEQLEADLDAVTQDKTAMQSQLDQMEHTIDELANKQAGQHKVTLELQVKKLTDQITSLRTEHQTACRNAKVLEEQLKSADAEKKAAQIYARQAERKVQDTNQRLANPHIIISNFESIFRMIEAIKSQIVAAKPLAPEDEKLIQGQIEQANTLLADLDNTLHSAAGELIRFARHLKPRRSKQSGSNTQ